MIVLKCKMCGGALAPEEGASTVRCEYCESVQTQGLLIKRRERKCIRFWSPRKKRK